MTDDSNATPEVHHGSLELQEKGDSEWPRFSIRAKVEGFTFDSQPVEIASAEPLQVEGGVHIIREHLRHMVAASIYCREVEVGTLEEVSGNGRTLIKDVLTLDKQTQAALEGEHPMQGQGEEDLAPDVEATRQALRRLRSFDLNAAREAAQTDTLIPEVAGYLRDACDDIEHVLEALDG